MGIFSVRPGGNVVLSVLIGISKRRGPVTKQMLLLNQWTRRDHDRKQTGKSTKQSKTHLQFWETWDC